MKPFTKIVNPYLVPVTVGWCEKTDQPRRVWTPVYVQIKYDDSGRLSITGVEGPKANGDCIGSCGQISFDGEGLKHLQPGWTEEMVRWLWDTWGHWHLNDCRPYSPEMKALGWHKKAKQPAWVWDFSASDETRKFWRSFKENSHDAARRGRPYTATDGERSALMAPATGLKIVTLDKTPPVTPPGMERQSDVLGAGRGKPKPPEKTTLGWVYPYGVGHPARKPYEATHPEGLLGRKVRPEDEHGYGGKWWKEEVPESILRRLAGLPDSEKTPAWV